MVKRAEVSLPIDVQYSEGGLYIRHLIASGQVDTEDGEEVQFEYVLINGHTPAVEIKKTNEMMIIPIESMVRALLDNREKLQKMAVEEQKFSAARRRKE